MDSVVLPNGRRTSRLGFGCADIVGGLSRRQSLYLLETAFAAGITHFDTAPSYGSGSSEEVLGEFLRRHPGECTVTTKYGLAAPSGMMRGINTLGRSTARLLLGQMPGLKARLARAHQALPSRASYSPDGVRPSVMASRSRLQLDYIDVLLLHEISERELTDSLQDEVKALVAEGTVGTWGVGGARSEIDALLSREEVALPVAQFEWSVLSPAPLDHGRQFTIIYGALSGAFAAVQGRLNASAETRHEWSDAVGIDLTPSTVARLLLAAALAANPDGLVLFTTRDPRRIPSAAERQAGDTEAAGRLATLAITHPAEED